jgi:hypothetical protein
MAYARLGVVSINSGQVTKATNYFSKAYALSKNVSEREKLYIAGHYYENVEGNLPKVVEALQEAIQAYPGQIDNYININVAYQTLGQYDQGLPYAQKAVEIDAQESIAGENLLSDYIALGRTADMRKELDRTEKLELNSSTSDLVIYMVAHFLLGEPQEVQRVMAKIAGRPDEFLATRHWRPRSSMLASTGWRRRPCSGRPSRRPGLRRPMRKRASFWRVRWHAGWLGYATPAKPCDSAFTRQKQAEPGLRDLGRCRLWRRQSRPAAGIRVDQKISSGHAYPGCVRTLVKSVCGSGRRPRAGSD